MQQLEREQVAHVPSVVSGSQTTHWPTARSSASQAGTIEPPSTHITVDAVSSVHARYGGVSAGHTDVSALQWGMHAASVPPHCAAMSFSQASSQSPTPAGTPPEPPETIVPAAPPLAEAPA